MLLSLFAILVSVLGVRGGGGCAPPPPPPSDALNAPAPCGVARSVTCEVLASGGDDGPAFVAASTDPVCDTVLIPANTTLNIQTRMDMTGIVNKHIQIKGTVRFNPNLPYWTGNAFRFAFQDQVAFWMVGGANILLDGGGTLDGSGLAWYDAFAKNSSLARPILFTLVQAQNVTIQNLNMINSPEWTNFVFESQHITFRNINIFAISTSKNEAKNTDGWDTLSSSHIVIENSNINNGDDCVSFKPNTTNVLVSNLSCNGSHGISVGSLGQFAGEFDIVQNITAINIKMLNAQNGARIKAWAGEGVGSGIVQNITFTGFTESNVDNPIIIDQCYMTDADACAEFPSNVLIQDVWFNNITGTSSGKEKAVVASLSCSPDGRCSNLNVNNITLTSPSKEGAASYTCQNAVLSGNAASLFGTCKTT